MGEWVAAQVERSQGGGGVGGGGMLGRWFSNQGWSNVQTVMG